MSDAGFIYFIEAIGSGAIKIGWAVSPQNRMRLLSTGCPLELKLLAIAAGCRSAERRLHIQFKSASLRGEWYTKTPELVDFIANVSERGALPAEIKITPKARREKPAALGAWIKANGMTREQFGKRIGVSPMCIQKWITGERFPRGKYFRLIQKVTGGEVQISDFFERAA